jgi:hypothetical protein
MVGLEEAGLVVVPSNLFRPLVGGRESGGDGR